MPPSTLAAILGHADLRSIGKYIHVRQEAMDEAMRDLDNAKKPKDDLLVTQSRLQ
jgi:hypothetical protein